METLLIAGDLAPTGRVASLFEEGRYTEVFSEVKNFVEHTDYALVNLEAPIVEGKGAPIKKVGPNLQCSKSVIEAMQYAGFNGATLANNHFCDYGEDGALTTMGLLTNAGLDYVGAGKNLQDATAILYKTTEDKCFAFINCCENEYSIATAHTAGSNPLNPISQYYAIKDATKKADYIVVIVHGGIEGYPLPTPRMQELYRFFIDCGADAVVNHHQHCYSGYETYHGKPIFYGLGNFCFDGNLAHLSYWYEGYMVKLVFDNGRIEYELIPYIQCKDEPKVEILKDKLGFNSEIERLNAIISDPVALEITHHRYMEETMNSQKYVLCPYQNKYLAALYVRGCLPGFLPLRRWRSLQNKIMCESHRERFMYFLNKKLK